MARSSSQRVAFDSPFFRDQDKSFLAHLNKSPPPPHLLLTAETPDFDPDLVVKFRSEGFHTTYVPLSTPHKSYIQNLHAIGEAGGVSREYAIVAYGDAASTVLTKHSAPGSNPPRLVSIVAYYPTVVPDLRRACFSPGVKVLVHFARGQVGVERVGEVLGVQGKKKIVPKAIGEGSGFGGGLGRLGQGNGGEGFLGYVYKAESGFAEGDLDEFDADAERVSFSRTVGWLRRAFRRDHEGVEGVERARDEFAGLAIQGQGRKGVEKWADEFGVVIFGPTLTGAVGRKDMARFYEDHFTPLPEKFDIKLVSRTVGADRVVDELFIRIVHDCEIDWLLPDIPPTNKQIEFMLVSIVCVRGTKLISEHVYWDQASVLSQAGLLPSLPKRLKDLGIDELPVTGAESSKAMKTGVSRHINQFISDW